MESLPDPFRAVVVGSSGGLGHAMMAALERNPRCAAVTGLHRNSDPAVELENEATIERAAEHLKRDGPLHLIVDATGVLHDADRDMAPEKSLSDINPEAIARSFAVNVTGPLLLMKHFHALLPRDSRCVFATLSARVGSIADNRLGGWYGYRASKAALNMFVRTAAIELARKRPLALCLALHPGTVATALSEPFAANRERLSPADAAQHLLRVIDTADKSGAFLAYDGTEIAW